MNAYLGRRSAGAVVPADDLVPILRHVTEELMLLIRELIRKAE